MFRESCWVWFKASLNEVGCWKGGFLATTDEKSGILIENPGYVTCRVPDWRVSIKEPINLKDPPDIPKDSSWKLF